MVRLEKPIDVSAGILGRTRTVPIRPAKSSATSRLTQRSLTVSIAARNSRNGSGGFSGGGGAGGESPANSAVEKLQIEPTHCYQDEQQPQELHEPPEQPVSPKPPSATSLSPQQQQRQPSQPPSIRSFVAGAADSLAGRFRRFNSGFNNSTNIGNEQRLAANSSSESHTGEEGAQLPDGWRYGRRSLALNRRAGKSVSITSVRESRTRDEIDRSAGASGGLSVPNQSELHTTRSIIKMRRFSDELPLLSLHNVESGAAGKGDGGPTLHQQREQKIFDECRFIPIDTFYKKVLIAPNQDRQFFASPKCNRVPGSSMLYDIANQNPMHHRDVNFDIMRDSLRKVCSTFYRTSQFRHPGY